MAAASLVLSLGLLHMRLFLWRMKSLGICPSWPSLRLLKVSGACLRALLVWRDPIFLLSGVRMGVICCRQMITTDASLSGWERFSRDDGLRCLVRQVPHLAHKRPGVESGSPSSHSLSSVPDTLTCHRQDEQHGGGVSHQSPGGLPVAHPEKACAPASSLGTGQVFVPESGPCPRGLEPSGGLLVKTETLEWMLNRRMVDHIFGKDLVRQRWTSLHRRSQPNAPFGSASLTCISEDTCASKPLAGHEPVCIPSSQAHPSGAVQCEDMRTPPSPSCPVLAFPDVVLGVGIPPGG